MASSGQGGIKFDDAKLGAALTNFPKQVDRALTAIMAFEAPRALGYMRSNAPWTDQTGNARSGLFAKPFREAYKNYGINLGHGVPYGIWLEVRFSGRYSIVGPTITSYGPQVMATVGTLFSRMGTAI